jgi:hypothetical protein
MERGAPCAASLEGWLGDTRKKTMGGGTTALPWVGLALVTSTTLFCKSKHHLMTASNSNGPCHVTNRVAPPGRGRENPLVKRHQLMTSRYGPRNHRYGPCNQSDTREWQPYP